MKKKQTNNSIVTKDEFVRKLGVSNYKLDLVRNGIFNISLSMRYLGSADLDVKQSDMSDLEIRINELQEMVNKLVVKLNLRIGDLNKNNEKKTS